jgi:hypothetical protein
MFHFLNVTDEFHNFVDCFIVSTFVQGDRVRVSSTTSVQGDRGKAPGVPHQVNVKYSNNL